jgi:molybdopterin converting factor subunit 1
MTDMIKIQVLFFASAREAAGNISSLELELDAGADTGTLRKTLAERYTNLAPMVLEEENLTLALNEEYVICGQIIRLKTGDTVALIPPISGG